MNLSDIFNDSKKRVKSNSPEILTAFGVTGVLTTSYLVAKASFKACRKIYSEEAISGTASDRKTRVKDRVKLVWKDYIPAATAGTVTIVCIVGSSKISSKRTAAAVSAYSLTEKAFSEYKEKVVEQIGENKERKIRDEIAQDKINENKTVIVSNKGEVLCCELLTGRYFKSDMEALRRAQNDINAKIISELYVSLDEFYDILGLPHTSQSDVLGWNSDKLMALVFTTTLSESGEPCLAFEYNYVKPL